MVLDGVSYGADVPRFVDALQPNTYEKTALEFFLTKTQEPLIVSKTTPSKVLDRYWTQYGKEFLESILDDTEKAASLFQLDDTPSNIILLAFEYQQRQNDIISTSSTMKTYRHLRHLLILSLVLYDVR